jgi:hypothetical protein
MKMAVANKAGQIDVLLNERLVGTRIKSQNPAELRHKDE